ncbi:hypothetical protein T492DRAFT_946108 [Pavlovales sp. CCMP2436]|nr:hypothetical protein T492DRAFT_946108 [Pavlovales sp. CCMP2436]
MAAAVFTGCLLAFTRTRPVHPSPHSCDGCPRTRSPHAPPMRSPRAVHMLARDDDDDGDGDGGKFARFGSSELAPECFGPPGCLCAGFTEEQLGIVGDAVDAHPGAAHVPIVVLAQTEMGQPLRKALEDMDSRDCVIPASPARVEAPLILFSGLEQARLHGIVATLVQARRAGSLPRDLAFALAVPRALDKRVAQIYEEVVDDQRANA